MNIKIKTIPHNQQRYPTCGDYWIDKFGNWQIRVSSLDSWKEEILIAIHEFIEMALCKSNNISEELITYFDMQFEKERALGMHGDKEPGFDKNAPYRNEHTFATKVEKMLAKQLNVNWEKYDQVITKL